MKKYKVNVNGTEYEVCVELIGDDGRAPAQVASTVSVPEKTAAPAAETTAASGEGEVVKAPLQGSIVAVNIAVGDTVKKGDVVMVLEAMKMENEILAAADGTVAAVNVSKGSTVETGTVLCTMA